MLPQTTSIWQRNSQPNASGKPGAVQSSATSFYATFQQLMLSLGIGVGAASLHVGLLGAGHIRPQLADFTLAFLVITAVSATATIWNRRFKKKAGAGLSHRAC